MAQDRFVKFCLASIVLLLGIIACKPSSPSLESVRAAKASEYLFEATGSGKGVVDVKLTEHAKQRVAEGWTLHSTPMGGLVWQR